MVTRKVIKACCGRQTFVFQLDKPIRKFQINVLEGLGYQAPQNFKDTGIFYVRKGQLIATASYGTRMIKVRCHGGNCPDQINEFETSIEQAINTDKLS